MGLLCKRARFSRLSAFVLGASGVFALATAVCAQSTDPNAQGGNSNAQGDNGPIVQTTQGRVQGFRTEGITEFLGIPFAAPPISTDPSATPCSPNNLRWCPPVAQAPWLGVRQATAYAPICAQIETLGVFAGPANNNEDVSISMCSHQTLAAIKRMRKRMRGSCPSSSGSTAEAMSTARPPAMMGARWPWRAVRWSLPSSIA